MKYTKEELLSKFNDFLDKNYKEDQNLVSLMLSFLETMDLDDTDQKNVMLFKNMINLFEMFGNMPGGLDQIKDIIPDSLMQSSIDDLFKSMFDNKMNSKDDKSEEENKKDDKNIN